MERGSYYGITSAEWTHSRGDGGDAHPPATAASADSLSASGCARAVRSGSGSTALCFGDHSSEARRSGHCQACICAGRRLSPAFNCASAFPSGPTTGRARRSTSGIPSAAAGRARGFTSGIPSARTRSACGRAPGLPSARADGACCSSRGRRRCSSPTTRPGQKGLALLIAKAEIGSQFSQSLRVLSQRLFGYRLKVTRRLIKRGRDRIRNFLQQFSRLLFGKALICNQRGEQLSAKSQLSSQGEGNAETYLFCEVRVLISHIGAYARSASG
jgi:hypothetical protein